MTHPAAADERHVSLTTYGPRGGSCIIIKTIFSLKHETVNRFCVSCLFNILSVAYCSVLLCNKLLCTLF